MFKLFRVYLVAFAILTFMLIGFVGIVDAIEIMSMRPEFLHPTEIGGNEYEDWRWHDYLYHTANVRTDKPFYDVIWYVDDELAGYTFWSDGPSTTEAFFSLYWLTGSHDGTTYTIKADAWTIGDNNVAESDTDSYELTVYRPFQIEEMYPAYGGHEGYDYGSGAYNASYVRTSEPYDRVEWYVGSDRQSTSLGDGVRMSAVHVFYLTSDSVKGTLHTITAVAWYEADNGEMVSNTKSYELTVYEPIIRTDVEGGGDPNLPNVDGHAELTRFYKSGSDVVVDWYVSAYYNGDNPPGFYNVTTEFKNTIQDFWGQGAHKQVPPVGDEAGPSGFLSTDNRSFVESGSISNSLVGGVKDKIGYDCAAYIRIKVSDRLADDWHFIHTARFKAD